MNKSLIVLLKNKFPNHLVVPQGANGADVFGQGAEHVLCIRDGLDLSAEMGCTHLHCAAPIPKDARVHKLLSVDGKDVIGLDDKAAERLESRKKYINDDGHIPSCFDLAAAELGHDPVEARSKKALAPAITSKMGTMFDEKQKPIGQAAPDVAAPAVDPDFEAFKAWKASQSK